MYIVTIWFYCTDRLNINHETARTFRGVNKEGVARRIENFHRQLDDAGWTVIRSAETTDVAHLQKTQGERNGNDREGSQED